MSFSKIHDAKCMEHKFKQMKKLSILFIALLSLVTAHAQVDRTKAPEPGPSTKLDLGSYTKFELKNGLKVIVVENHKFPTVSYNVMLDLDPLYEGDKAGYTEFAGDLLSAGTASLSKDELDEKVDFIGARLSTSSSGIMGSCLKKHSDELLSLMTDVLYHPSFPQGELDKLVKQALTGLKTQKDDPQSISSNVSKALMFGKNTAYGEVITEATVQNITIDDCKEYYNTYFRPNTAYLVIVGDVTVKEAKKIAKKNFSQWEAKEVPSHQFVKPELAKEPVYAMSHKDASTQAIISVCYAVDLKPGTPDALKASVMNSILGSGGFSARLFKNLREEKAWTYGAYSSLRSNEYMGTFKAYANVRASIADSALIEIRKEMQRMIDEKVTPEELQLIKNTRAGAFGRSLEDPATIATFAVNIDKYNLPADYYATYMERLEAVTVDDVQDMARKYLRPENAIYLAVGDVKVIEPLLEKMSGGKTVTEYDVYGDKVVRSGLPAGLTATDVLNSYVKAIGGIDALTKVNDLAVTAGISVQGMQLQLNTYQEAPNKICVETKMGEAVLSKQVYNGTDGKIIAQGQEQKLEGDMLEDMKLEAILFPELSYEANGCKLELNSVEKVEGSDAYKLTVTTPYGKNKVMFFDTKTGLKVKEVTTNQMGSSTILLSDYKTFDGILFATKMNQTVGPQSFDVEITSIDINKGIDSKKFE